MEAPGINQPCSSVVSVRYAWNGENRNRCFCIVDGEPVLIDCKMSRQQVAMRGLGDVIAAVTSAVGIKPCGGCKERQEALNKAVPFGKPEVSSD